VISGAGVVWARARAAVTFDAQAVLAANASPVFHSAKQACAAQLTIGKVFASGEGLTTDVPLRARPLVALVDVGAVVPQTNVSPSQQDSEGNSPKEVARFKAVRELHDDAERIDVEVALVRVAAGDYGTHAPFALAHPSELHERATQHRNAQILRRGERPNSVMALR
jgi:hypothetical protein